MSVLFAAAFSKSGNTYCLFLVTCFRLWKADIPVYKSKFGCYTSLSHKRDKSFPVNNERTNLM